MKLRERRNALRAVPLGEGRALVVGGWVWDTLETPTLTELYDPAKKHTEEAGALSIGRRLPGAARLADGRVLVAGGTGPDGKRLRSSELWDPATRAWTPAGDLPHELAGARMLALDDGGALCHPLDSASRPFPAGVARWSADGGWTQVPPSFGGPSGTPWEGPDWDLLAIGLSDGRVLFLGSWRAPLVWDGETFEPAGPSLERTSFGAVALPDGGALIVGGVHVEDPVREALRWTPDGRFEPAGTLSVARPELPVAVGLADGRVAVLAGVGVDDRYPKQIDVWDPRTRTFSAEAQVKRGRFGFGVVAHDGALHLIGGATGQGREIAEVEVIVLPEATAARAPTVAASAPEAAGDTAAPTPPTGEDLEGRILEVDEARARALRAALQAGTPVADVLGDAGADVRWVRVTGPGAEAQLFHLAQPAFHAYVYDADDFLSLDGEDRLVYQGEGMAFRGDDPDADLVTLGREDLAEGLVVATDDEVILAIEWLGEAPGLEALDRLRDAAARAWAAPAA